MNDIEEAIALAKSILEDIEELPEVAEDFAASVGEKAASIIEWIEEHDHVTDGQIMALENMRDGIDRWLHL